MKTAPGKLCYKTLVVDLFHLNALFGLISRRRLFAIFLLGGLSLAACGAPQKPGDAPPRERTLKESPVVEVEPTKEPIVNLQIIPEEPLETIVIEAEPVKVALLLPLTGEASPTGQLLLKAAQLSFFDHAPEEFELLIRDTEGSHLKAHSVAQEVISEGAELIIGPLFRNSVASLRDIARDNGVAVLAFSNDQSIAAEGVYTLSTSPEEEIQALLSFARQRGLKRFAFLVPDNGYGERLLTAARQALYELGGLLVRSESYQPGLGDQRAAAQAIADYAERNQAYKKRVLELEQQETKAAEEELEKLKGRDTLDPPDYEAIFVAAGGKDLLTLAPLLNYYDVDPAEVQYMGPSLWDDPSLAREPTLINSWFAGQSQQNWPDFARRYQGIYGQVPDPLAALAYDAVALAAIIARNAEVSSTAVDYSSSNLSNPSGFMGLSGFFRLNSNGKTDHALAIKTLRKNSVEVIDPAPLTLP